MGHLEKYSIEDIMLGNGNVFAVIGRVQKALRKSGCTKDYVDYFVQKCMNDFHEYNDVLSYCMETLEEAGFQYGKRELTEQEKLIKAIYSGENDSLTIKELRNKLNIEKNGEE